MQVQERVPARSQHLPAAGVDLLHGGKTVGLSAFRPTESVPNPISVMPGFIENAAMSLLQKHLRNTFLAGIFAAIPLAVTVFIVWYVEHATREPLRQITGINIPFVGIVAAVVGIYLLGLAVSSLIGKLFLRLLDWILLHVPVLRDLYQAWKQVALTPGGKEGMYARVVLVPLEGQSRVLGFTSGDPLPGDGNTWCVFVPNSPNPVLGRLYFVARERCQVLDISVEEAFKCLISTGNYIPPQVGVATAA